MSTRAQASFSITSWEQANYDTPEEGPSLARATVTKTFEGDLEGESIAELLICRSPDGGAAYAAQERVSGTLAGRTGSFVLQHSAAHGEGAPPDAWFVVPSSGTGELRGLRGTAEYCHDDEHATLTIDYELASGG